jgi:hypothetical protein
MSANKKISEVKVEQTHGDLELKRPAWQRFSYSAERLATKLLEFRNTHKNEEARKAYCELSRLAPKCYAYLSAHRRRFTAISSTGGVVSILEDRSYPTAHQTAVGEVRLVLYFFTNELSNDSGKHCRDLFDDWGRAKDTIDRILSVSWHRQFLAVPALIQQERTLLTVKSRGSSQLHQLQVPNLPVVNLALNQIRHNGECHDVTAKGARLVDCLVKAWPDWFPTEKNGFTKASVIKKSFPAPIRELIETESGKGYRLKIK